MTEYETAANKCPNCNHTFRTLADEWGMHQCPRCRYEPQREEEDEVPFNEEDWEEDEDDALL